MLLFMVLKANCCSSVNFLFSSLCIFLCMNGFLSTSFATISTNPFFSSVFTIALLASVNISISETVASSFSSKNFNTRICFSDFIILFSIAFSISSVSFAKYTKLISFSFVLFSNSLVAVPGGNISFKQSDILQKYLLDIHFASSMFSFENAFPSNFTISFILYSELCFIFITNPSSSFFPFPNGTNTLEPIFILSANSSGIL